MDPDERETTADSLQAIKVLAGLSGVAVGYFVLPEVFPFSLIPLIFAAITGCILCASVPRANIPIVIGCAIQIGYGLWVLVATGMSSQGKGGEANQVNLFGFIDPLILVGLAGWLAFQRSMLLAWILTAYQLLEICVTLGALAWQPLSDLMQDVLRIQLFYRAAGIAALGIGFLEIRKKAMEMNSAGEIGAADDAVDRSNEDPRKEEEERLDQPRI